MTIEKLERMLVNTRNIAIGLFVFAVAIPVGIYIANKTTPIPSHNEGRQAVEVTSDTPLLGPVAGDITHPHGWVIVKVNPNTTLSMGELSTLLQEQGWDETRYQGLIIVISQTTGGKPVEVSYADKAYQNIQ